MIRTISLPSIIVLVCSAVRSEVRYQNWRHLSKADPFCSPTQCDLTEIGQVSINEMKGCLDILSKPCNFTVEAVHSYAASFRDQVSFLCWAPDKGPAGVSGMSVPDFYPEREWMNYAGETDGRMEIQFLGLQIPKGETCDLYLLNQDVRFERGCGWNLEDKKYEDLIPDTPFYTFTEAERKLVVEGSALKDLIHSMSGPGLFFVWKEDRCSKPLSAYSFTFKTKLGLTVNGLVSTRLLSISTLFLITYSLL